MRLKVPVGLMSDVTKLKKHSDADLVFLRNRRIQLA